MTIRPSLYLGMSRSSYSILGVALALIALIGAIDWWLPLGLTITTLYVVPVLIASRIPHPRITFWVAALASCVTVLDLFRSPLFALTWVVAINRAFALMVIWVTALLCLRRQRDEAELLRINEDIEQQVQERTSDLAAANQELEVLRAEAVSELVAIDAIPFFSTLNRLDIAHMLAAGNTSEHSRHLVPPVRGTEQGD